MGTITLSTVGYGDVIPITIAGKIFGVFITVLGVGMAALPAGIIASGFTREVNKRREAYRTMVRDALADGVLDKAERRSLRNYSLNMGIKEEEAMGLLKQESHAMPANAVAPVMNSEYCPHCGHPVARVA